LWWFPHEAPERSMEKDTLRVWSIRGPIYFGAAVGFHMRPQGERCCAKPGPGPGFTRHFESRLGGKPPSGDGRIGDPIFPGVASGGARAQRLITRTYTQGAVALCRSSSVVCARVAASWEHGNTTETIEHQGAHKASYRLACLRCSPTVYQRTHDAPERFRKHIAQPSAMRIWRLYKNKTSV
jgi:hypothetical protein